MNTTKTLLATLLATTALTGCMTGSDAEAPLTYEEFKATYISVTESPSGHDVIVYDWDQPLKSEDQVRALYDVYLDAKTAGETLSEATVNMTLYGQVDVWPAAQAQNLTYCVSDAFGARKQQVVSAMSIATGDWTKASNGKLRWTYLPQYDAACNTATPTTFDVNPKDGNNVYATAFFPSWTRDQRSVYIHAPIWNGDFPPEGILRHELGHSIGLRHETTRTEAVVKYGFHCFEDVFTRPVTAYDDNSVMATPACMGANVPNKALSLSAGDVQGIQALYR
jgi:hypothetical protein